MGEAALNHLFDAKPEFSKTFKATFLLVVMTPFILETCSEAGICCLFVEFDEHRFAEHIHPRPWLHLCWSLQRKKKQNTSNSHLFLQSLCVYAVYGWPNCQKIKFYVKSTTNPGLFKHLPRNVKLLYLGEEKFFPLIKTTQTTCWSQFSSFSFRLPGKKKSSSWARQGRLHRANCFHDDLSLSLVLVISRKL